MELKTLFAQDPQGSILVSPTVYVYQAGTTNAAAGVKDKDGTALAHPFAGGANGLVQFQAPNGEYDVRVVSSLRDFTVRVRLVDVTEAIAAGNAAAGQVLDDAQQIMLGYVDAAKNQVSVAAGHAASAAAVAQQDLSGVTAAALHRSPNAVTAMFIYDTSKDSDGGAWIERCAHTSWFNEPLNGKWLGWVANEAAARAVAGAATGDYFGNITDGKHYKLNAGAGVTETFRGNTAKFPRLAAIVAEQFSFAIYALDQPGRPMWMVFTQTQSDSDRWFLTGGDVRIAAVAMLNGVLAVGKRHGGFAHYGHLRVANFASDRMRKYNGSYNNRFTSPVGIAKRHSNEVGFSTTSEGNGLLEPNGIVSGEINAIAMTVLPDAPADPVTGLQVPTIAVGTGAGVSVIKGDGSVFSTTGWSTVYQVGWHGTRLVAAGSGDGVWGAFVFSPDLSSKIFYSNLVYSPPNPAGAVLAGGAGSIDGVVSSGRVLGVKNSSSFTGFQLVVPNLSARSAAPVAYVAPTYNTGWMAGDVRRCLLADVSVAPVADASTVADRSYKNKPITACGTLTRAPVSPAAQLVAYSGFSAANYLQEAYSADLDFGTGAWSVSAWVNYATAVASTIAERSAAAGAYITLGTDATGKLTATAHDGTTPRTVTTAAAYNSGTWAKVRATYSAGTLAIDVNGVQVASTAGAALLTLNNAAAVCTVGNNRALTAAFPGTIALVKWSATAPTAEQALFMYEQEKQMFRDGAQVTLPDAGNIVDLAYDEATDKWVAISADNESAFTGLVRTSTLPVTAGIHTKAAARSGVKLLARSTASPGVDVTIPAQGLREELINRAEAAARLARQQFVFDFDAATSQTDFTLPAGWTAVEVISNGASKREGTTKDWTRLFDGFRETIRFAVAPGNGVWVQIAARRNAG